MHISGLIGPAGILAALIISAAARPDVVRNREATLDARRSGLAFAGTADDSDAVPLTAEDEERLRALGYLH